MVADRPPTGPRRRLLGGVRLRTTVAGVLVVGIAFAAGSVVLVAATRRTLLDDVAAVTRLRAEEVAAQLAAGEQPSLSVSVADEQLVQVIDASGAVVASSGNVAGLDPVAAMEPGETTRLPRVIDDDEFQAVAVGVRTADGERVVIVARSIEDALESSRAIAGLLAIGGPLLLLVVGSTTWVLTGRALAPVERIRSEVEAISSTELHRRVHEPATGDEIARLAATMNRMLARLQDGHDRQRRFVADAAHELRTPLAVLRTHAEVAKAHPDGSSLDDLAGTVVAESLHMQELVDDLILLARSDEGGTSTWAEVDLDDVVLDEVRHLRGATDVRLDTRDVSAARVLGDTGSLHRVLRNLLHNAARHATSAVVVSLGVVDGTAVLTVDDDGPGIPAGDRARVFERFVRLDEGRDRDSGGSGLGLAIVRSLVEAHRGTVAAGESPTGGARLTVRVPVAP